MSTSKPPLKMSRQPAEKFSLLDNSRFYVLVVTICASLILFFWLRITIVDPRLRGIRFQQILGLMAVLYWYFVMLMSAGSKVIGQRKWLPGLLFTRRAFGVGVAYFALLHFLVGFTQQLGGWHGIWLLPIQFKLALLCGLTALVVLLVMSALSIDALVAKLKFTKWKLLGRISYCAGILVIVHVWIIGTHVSSLLLQLVSLHMLALLFGLEAWKYCMGLQKKGMARTPALVTAISLWIVLMGALLVMRAFVPSYGNDHVEHLQAGTEIHAH